MAKLSSTDKPVTKAELQEFYQQIFPYLGGNKAVDSNPVGHFGFFLLPSAPAGYLECKGQRLSATAFPLLFNALKEFPAATRATWGAGDADWITEFDLPDMRGEFPRCSGNNSHENQGSGANVGVHQDATTIPRNINDTTYHFEYFGRLATSENRNVDSTVYSSVPIDQVSTNVYTQGSETPAEITTRPTNTSFLGCVKYTYVTQEVEYSEVERVVGTDENGNDLYRVSFIGQRTINDVQYITTPSNIQIKSIDGYLILSGGTVVKMGYYNSAKDRFMPYYDGDNHRIVIQACNLQGEYRFVLEYTKSSGA